MGILPHKRAPVLPRPVKLQGRTLPFRQMIHMRAPVPGGVGEDSPLRFHSVKIFLDTGQIMWYSNHRRRAAGVVEW